jgi:hypothetical protein
MRLSFPALRTSLTLSLILGLITACASTPPAPDVDYKHSYDFSQVRTFAFQSGSGTASGNSARAFLSDMEVNRINDAIADALELKGMKMVDDAFQANVLIAWHLVAQEKTDVRTYNTGPSYGGGYGSYGGYNRSSMYNCWNCGGTQVSVRNYTQGTFIVDIIDPSLNQSVWRAVIQSKLKEKANPDQQAYNASAQRILAAFPPH